MRERRRRRFVADDEVGDHRARRGTHIFVVARDGADRVDAGQRLADDAARERRRGLVRLAGTHGDGRQPQGAAVDEALARHVVDQVFADRLLRAVRGLRRQRRVVGHRIGQRAAEHRERAREHEFRRRGQAAAALEQRARRVEVDAHADVEVRLGLAAHDGGEMEHGIGVGGERRVRSPRDRRDRRRRTARADRRSPARARRRAARSRGRSRACRARRSSVPRASSARARRVPRKPAPPVITMRMGESLSREAGGAMITARAAAIPRCRVDPRRKRCRVRCTSRFTPRTPSAR